MKRMKILSLLVVALTLTGCARNMASNAYRADAVAGLVLEGTVVSSRPVTINTSDTLAGHGTGLLAGGATGGLLGSEIGKGKGKDAATAAGALAGAMVGAMIEESLTRQGGYEYVIRLTPESMASAPQNEHTYNYNVNVTDMNKPGARNTQSIQNKIQNGTQFNTTSGIISVAQVDSQPIARGSRVFVIYSDDRPRVVPAY